MKVKADILRKPLASRINCVILLGAVTMATLALAYAPSAHAAGVVTTCDEANLDAAVSGGGTVTFACSGTISFSAAFTISADTTIDGTGQNVTLTRPNLGFNSVSCNSSGELFYVSVGVELDLKNLTINNVLYSCQGTLVNLGTLSVANSTLSQNSGVNGGTISNFGTLTVTNSTFLNNTAGQAGAIWNRSANALTVSNSTFSGNTASGQRAGAIISLGPGAANITNTTFSGNSTAFGGDGGAIDVTGGTATITNCTFSGNIAGEGGGLHEDSGTVTVTNSTFSGNSAVFPSGRGGGIQAGGGGVSGKVILQNTIVSNSLSGNNCDNEAGDSLVDGGGNLDDDGTCGVTTVATSSLMLDPSGLQNNGGPTQTLAILPGSVAIDAAVDANCPVTDQRGVARPQGPHCDVGAYELIEQSTPAGTNVAVPLNGGNTVPGGASLMFSSVTAAGNTTLTTSGTGAPPPTGFKLGIPPTYFQFSTTAVFSGSVAVCINYGGIAFRNASKLKLFHIENPNFVDVTTSNDTINMIICGSVTSFSSFAVMEPVDQPPVAVINGAPAGAVECASHGGTQITLEGSASSDPDGDALTYAWTEDSIPVGGNTPILTVTVPLGTHSFALTVTDPGGLSNTATAQATVQDTTPPTLTLSTTNITVTLATASATGDSEPDWNCLGHRHL
ncbi:MAG: choice-of-anchor Q domain-containing protein [Candidatus Acidiferrales bacterium]